MPRSSPLRHIEKSWKFRSLLDNFFCSFLPTHFWAEGYIRTRLTYLVNIQLEPIGGQFSPGGTPQQNLSNFSKRHKPCDVWIINSVMNIPSSIHVSVQHLTVGVIKRSPCRLPSRQPVRLLTCELYAALTNTRSADNSLSFSLCIIVSLSAAPVK